MPLLSLSSCVLHMKASYTLAAKNAVGVALLTLEVFILRGEVSEVTVCNLAACSCFLILSMWRKKTYLLIPSDSLLVHFFVQVISSV